MQYAKENKQFYHASPRRFQIGQILTATMPVKKNYEWCQRGIFVTDKPAAHYTIFHDIKNKGWHLYEVEPLCKMEKGRYSAEWIAREVVIKSYIGVIGGRLGGLMSDMRLVNKNTSIHKPRYKVLIVPHAFEDRHFLDSDYAYPYGFLSEKLLNKGFNIFQLAYSWAKLKAQEGDIIYIFDRRKTGKTQRIRKERVKMELSAIG